MASSLKFDEVSFKPADTPLLSLVEDGEPAVLRCPPGRCGIERLKAWCR